VVDKLVKDANARVVCIVDKNGQLIAASGETENLDTTSLASLIAGTIAAMGGMAKLLKENEFPTQFHEGVKANIHIQLVGNRVILAVIFDSRATLGLVRLRVKRASDELNAIFEALLKGCPRSAGPFNGDHRRGHRQPLQRLSFGPAKGSMSFINYLSREINCKIVYYGPGLCGKTTNLQWIYQRTAPEAKGKMISLATEQDRTLFFDFLPLSLGEIRGFKTRFHLYTVPGQVFYDASRKLILKGVDGVVFVADSQIERMEANLESLENLQHQPRGAGLPAREAPLRDPVQQARPAQHRAGRGAPRAAQPHNVPEYEAVASKGIGVFDTLKAVAKLVLTELKRGSGGIRIDSVHRPPLPAERGCA
jgi:predicted regulator of Ras-like GTPase activity (Roadblock/LC7/MglB family)/signal recognition particle receptor subunit beta